MNRPDATIFFYLVYFALRSKIKTLKADSSSNYVYKR